MEAKTILLTVTDSEENRDGNNSASTEKKKKKKKKKPAGPKSGNTKSVPYQQCTLQWYDMLHVHISRPHPGLKINSNQPVIG